MQVKRIGYLGLRTDDVEATTAFFRDVLGLATGGERGSVTYQHLPSGRLDLVEVYAADLHDPRMIPDGVDFVGGFMVDNVREALAEARASGVEILGEPVWAAEAFDNPAYGDLGWFWVRAPDGRVYVIQQVPD